jgi:hypothetical protein
VKRKPPKEPEIEDLEPGPKSRSPIQSTWRLPSSSPAGRHRWWPILASSQPVAGIRGQHQRPAELQLCDCQVYGIGFIVLGQILGPIFVCSVFRFTEVPFLWISKRRPARPGSGTPCPFFVLHSCSPRQSIAKCVGKQSRGAVHCAGFAIGHGLGFGIQQLAHDHFSQHKRVVAGGVFAQDLALEPGQCVTQQG